MTTPLPADPVPFPMDPLVQTLQRTLDNFYVRCRELGYSEAAIDKMVTDCAVQSGATVKRVDSANE